ncbi:hypothetical protein KR032_006131 [Drosophila birchii]|nr:hypothetical protein KR032_006131 [Drosophila birchii]
MSTKKKKTKVPKSQSIVPRFCQRVIDDVVSNMRQAFLDDGVGEQALQRMLHMWRSKMMSSKSIDLSPAISPHQDANDSSQEPFSSSSKPSLYMKPEICEEDFGTANQLDGALDHSDEEDDDTNLDYNDNEDEQLEEESETSQAENSEAEEEGVKEEPLNSGDDITDDESIEDKFDTENLVACQYDVVSRSRNKWKFIFRDGMMRINGKEFMFKRAEGEAVW